MEHKETHILVVWPNSLVLRGGIEYFVKEIEAFGEISAQTAFRFDAPKDMQSFFNILYADSLKGRDFKLRECGAGLFYAFKVLLDDRYSDQKTTSGIQQVNTASFNLKLRLRGATGGGHKIHGTINQREFAEDAELFLLQGTGHNHVVDWSEYLALSNTSPENRPGANYSILRGIAAIEQQSGADYDILCTDETVETLRKSLRLIKQNYRPHACAYTQAGTGTEYDIRPVSSDYVPQKMAQDLLTDPAAKMLTYSPAKIRGLLYHCLVHKNAVADKYIDLLSEQGFHTLEDISQGLKNSYPDPFETVPCTDRSVGYYNYTQFNHKKPNLERRLFWGGVMLKSFVKNAISKPHSSSKKI